MSSSSTTLLTSLQPLLVLHIQLQLRAAPQGFPLLKKLIQLGGRKPLMKILTLQSTTFTFYNLMSKCPKIWWADVRNLMSKCPDFDELMSRYWWADVPKKWWADVRWASVLWPHCITGGWEGVGILRKHLHTGLYSGCVNPAAERRVAGDSKKVPLSGLARLECSS